MIKKRLTLAGLLVFSLSLSSIALEPYWEWNVMLKFHNEGGEIAQETRFKATVCGVETWYHEFRWNIEEFVSNGPFMGWLPDLYLGWRYTEINAYTLTESIWYTNWLNLLDVPWDVYSVMTAALTNDRNGTPQSDLDPYYQWKWRSKYMENRYQENGIGDCVFANCYGTADYLAKDREWIGWYEGMYPNGASRSGETFPHIYLTGSQIAWGHKIDLDLDGSNGNVELRGWGPAADYPYPGNVVNAFDVILML